jgi:hypothetical protein
MQTEHKTEGIRRRRKCEVCKKLFHTMESLYILPEKEAKPVIYPDARGLYQPKDVPAIKMQKVEVRRKNEDRKMRVSNYFIEDDYD